MTRQLDKKVLAPPLKTLMNMLMFFQTPSFGERERRRYERERERNDGVQRRSGAMVMFGCAGSVWKWWQWTRRDTARASDGEIHSPETVLCGARALCLVAALRGLDREIRGVDDGKGWWQLQRQDSSASARAWWSEKLTDDRACDLIAAATTLLWLWRWIEHGLDCERGWQELHGCKGWRSIIFFYWGQ